MNRERVCVSDSFGPHPESPRLWAKRADFYTMVFVEGINKFLGWFLVKEGPKREKLFGKGGVIRFAEGALVFGLSIG